MKRTANYWAHRAAFWKMDRAELDILGDALMDPTNPLGDDADYVDALSVTRGPRCHMNLTAARIAFLNA